MTQKPLARGYTTGTCAQAATKAAMWMLMTGKPCEKVQVELPQGETLALDICEIKFGNGEGGKLLP